MFRKVGRGVVMLGGAVGGDDQRVERLSGVEGAERKEERVERKERRTREVSVSGVVGKSMV